MTDTPERIKRLGVAHLAAALMASGMIAEVGGEDITIRDLATLVGKVVGFTGKIEWDTTKPDGTPRKLLDVTRLAKLGWKAKTPLEAGLRATYQWWLEHGQA